MALGPITKAVIALSKKTAKAASKKAAKSTAKKGAKSAAKKTVRSRIAKAVGTSSIGGVIGSLLSRSPTDDTSDTSTEQAASDTTSQSSNNQDQAAPADDAFISFAGLAEAIAAAMPIIHGPDSSNRNIENTAGVIVRSDVELDYLELNDDQIPFIPKGTYISARIPEIGQLFQVTDMLRQQVGMLDADLDQVNANLKKIAKKIGLAIETNRDTARRNERRRDEEDAENKEENIKSGSFIKDAATVAALSVADKLMPFMGAAISASVLAGINVIEPYLNAETEEEAAEEESGIPEDDIAEEKISSSEEASMLDNALGWLDKAESNDNDKTFMQSVVGAGLSDEVTALSVIGAAGGLATTGATAIGATAAAGTLSMVAPLAAAAGAGYMIGTVINEQTGLKEAISGAISDHLAGDSIDLGTMTSPEAMAEKYEGKQGAELLGDLLGEGTFDLAEPPEDIIAAFKDIDSMEKYNKLAAEYKAKYERPLTSALNDVLGTKGVESVFNLITQNAINKINREKKSGVEETPKATEPVIQGIRTVDLGDLPEGYETLQGTPELDKIYYGSREQVEDLQKAGYKVNALPNTYLHDPNIPSGAVAYTILEKPAQNISQNNNTINNEDISQSIVNPIMESVVLSTEKSFNMPLKTSQMPNIEGDIEEKQTQIVPIVLPVRTKKAMQRETSAGTQARSTIESATPSMRTNDSFLRLNYQT